MRKRLALLCLLFCVGISCAFAGAHNFQIGKLLDVSTDERLVEGTTNRHVIFTVQIADVVYTLRGGHASPRGKDYAGGLIVGDAVQASVEGENVILLKPDGKDIKTAILKRERVHAN